MPAPTVIARRLLPRAAAGLALLLALAGLVERWGTPDIPFRLRHLQVVPREDLESSGLAPLAPGDRLLALDGAALGRDLPAMGALAAAARRGPVTLKVARGAQELELRPTFSPPGPARRFGWLLRTLAALSVFAMGLWVRRRRRDALSGVFLALALLTGSLFALAPRLGGRPWASLLEAFVDLVALFLPPVLLHFLILFPERRRRRRIVHWLVYLPPTLLALPVIVGIAVDLPRGEAGNALRLLQAAAGLNTLVLLGASIVLVLIKSLRKRYRRERHRLRGVLVGSLFSLLPLAIFLLLHELLPGRRLPLADWTPLFLTFLPLSFTYGILGPDLSGINRRARFLRRLLLGGGITAMLFVGLRLLLTLVWGRGANLAEDLFAELFALMLSLLGATLLLRRGRRWLRAREEQPFADTARLLAPPRLFSSREELGRSLLPHLGGDAGAGWLLWLEREEDGVWTVRERWRWEGGPPRSITLPEPGTRFRVPPGLERALLSDRRLLAVEQWDPYWAESLMGPAALPYCRERDWSVLAAVGAELEAPGLIVLGPSLAGPLYAGEVVDGLKAVADTLDLHLRNLSLLDRAAHEEQLRRELELARSIQKRLLPQRKPELPGIELAGRVLTSSEVGGDYYDYLLLPEDRLGLALGDATGHGIPAALLISSVALAFHTQAADGRPPEAVLGSMNQALHALVADHATPEVFAGFIYVQYDRRNSTLEYCNGGMPPPWVIRADGGVERLSRGGTLLGAAAESSYQRGILRLRPGDLLFLRSDGLADQERGGQEYGEDRLLQWIGASRRTNGLESLADSLIAELSGFADSARNDDISFVLMRLSA